MNGLYSFKANLTPFSTPLGHLLFVSSYLYFKGMFQAKFDIMTYFHLNMLKENSKSVARLCFAMLYVFERIVLKLNQDCASISIDATPHQQKARYVNETSRVDSLFTQHYTESIMIMYNVDLHF